MKTLTVNIIFIMASASFAWCQDMTMVQLKVMNRQLEAYPELEIVINHGTPSRIGQQGVAFVELAAGELPPKLVSVVDDKLEVESWNFSKGVLEIIVREKTYKVVSITVQDQRDQLLEGVTVAFQNDKSISAVSNDLGVVELTVPLEVNLNKTDQLYVDGYLLIEKRIRGNQGVLKIKPIPKTADSRKIEQSPIINSSIAEIKEIDEFQHFNFEYLDSIRSLTVFYAVIKNMNVEDFDESMKRKADAKFYQLIGQWEDSLKSVRSENFIGKISDSSVVQHDVSILIDQALDEDRTLTRIRDEFDTNVSALDSKLQGGGMNLSDEETQQILEGIALLSKILDENEDKFYENQTQFRETLASLTNRLRSISDLEEKLIQSESQRVKQSKDFNQKLMTAMVISLALALFGIISFVLYNKFKKQKNQLFKANAEVKRVNEQLEDLVSKRTNQLQDANKELDTFLYKSSHDLRRPLTTIVGLSNIAQMTLDKDSLELFDRVSNTARQMDKMLKKLIHVNEIHHPSKYSPIDFEKQVEHSIDQFKDTIREKKIAVESMVEKDLTYKSYPEVIEIIFKSLLENAVCFSTIDEKQNAPKVEIKVTQNNGHVSIQLKDNGPGIENKVQDKIWDMFFVGHEKSTGNGLGLYLAQKAVKALDGSIHLQSGENKMTIFEVQLPVNGS